MTLATLFLVALLLAPLAVAGAAPDRIAEAARNPPSKHWSFQPRKALSGPHTIDEFIEARLAELGLRRAPPADPISLIRRLAFDLTGLPPTPEQVAAFVTTWNADSSTARRDASVGTVVDEMLSSPRHGERWAQHWLDVVRYADTHGFEVNTERAQAWPYRDYVIRAFNHDTPYDRFIREQIVGDALGEDAATGFLVTASVLLPGQIGKDALSIRLARQDALDEIVSNIGQTFLGLSIGCARCHDHKFDPISARDYYAMQAFVAGVEYGDRVLRTPEAEARQKEAAPWRQRVQELNERLAQLVPVAHPASSESRATRATLNIETFAPIEAKFVRFTIHDANLHPSLGLIEPCVDEFEVFTDEPEPRNVALASHGTRVTASGSRTSSDHKLEHLNDGRYGNARSWMADTPGRGWVMLELPAPVRLGRVAWSRDRAGKFPDRLATAYTLEAGLTADQLTVLTELRPLRTTVQPRLNTDRFSPVRAKRLRFTIHASNSLEPCLDELEVINPAGRNVALARAGTQVKTSGDTVVPDRHEPRFLNDGQYGNSRSWLSREPGRGWVELEFPTEEEITRVVWSRDREGKLEDRLPTEYRIEITRGDAWTLVADSSDRRPFVAGMDLGPEFTLAGLNSAERAEAVRLLEEKRSLENRIKSADAGQLAFAGTFRKPDTIHLLRRGDPEQPQEEVGPGVPRALGQLTLPRETPEQDRRKALAEWIADPLHPLTARVMVNRIWQGHFGTGLVETPSDFGQNGMRPTHPELLDWLAQEFVRSGWSIKRMHRLIVMSQTYRQASRPDDSHPAIASRDGSGKVAGDARWLARFPRRRMEAEVIRDSILAVSGRLNLAMHGRGFDLFDQRGGLSGFTPVEKFSQENERRMIYAHKVRREREAVFGAFDCPDAGQSTARRRESTTPIQALNLFNSRFTLVHAGAFAARVQKEAGEDPRQQITRAYLSALSRPPTTDEIAEVEPEVRAHGLAVLGRALFNCNEFLFVP